MPIVIDSSRLSSSAQAMLHGLRRPQRVYQKASIHMREYVRRTITLQGRKRSYATLSDWTRKKTGRRKALITLRKYIKSRFDSRSAEVYFQQPDSSWHIDQHHRGYTVPARKKLQVVQFKDGTKAFFQKAKPSKVPAREIWPTQKETLKEVRPIFKTWIDGLARRGWR